MALGTYFIFGTNFAWNDGIICFNVACMLLGHNFDYFGGYLVVTARYWWLLLLTAHYCSFLLLVWMALLAIPRYSKDSNNLFWLINTFWNLLKKACFFVAISFKALYFDIQSYISLLFCCNKLQEIIFRYTKVYIRTYIYITLYQNNQRTFLNSVIISQKTITYCENTTSN